MKRFHDLLKCDRPILMGILNLTPDSFSDGDPGATVTDFLKRAEGLIRDGADILDIGGESTRPHAGFVDVETEKQRVIPFLKEFRRHHPRFPISLDTKKYEVAREALSFGIQVLNDVSFLSDVRFLDLAYEAGAYYVLMHSRGNSQTMMQLTAYPDGVVQGLKQELSAKLEFIGQTKFPLERLILDLGFGFAKSPDQCVALINHLSIWRTLGQPLLFGVSRKRFLQKYTGENAPAERDRISAELARKAYENGFQIIRTHNVGLTREVLSRLNVKG